MQDVHGKLKTAMATAAFNKKATFTSKVDLAKCYTLSTDFYGAEFLDVSGKQIRNTLNFLKCGAGRRWRRSSCDDHVNE